MKNKILNSIQNFFLRKASYTDLNKFRALVAIKAISPLKL